VLSPFAMKQAKRTRLVEDHLPLVRHLAARLIRQAQPYLEIDDLVAIGTEALLRATERYDSSRGVAFGTFAYLRVRGAMFEGIGVVAPLTRGVIRKRRDRPERRSLPVLCRLDERRVRSAAHDGDLEEEVAAALDSTRLTPRLTVALDELEERDRQLIMRHYFGGDTLDDIGRDMGRSRSWASRVHSRALSRLREALEPGVARLLGAAEPAGAHTAEPARLARAVVHRDPSAAAWRAHRTRHDVRAARARAANAALRAA
jgi:RNA polymerase sigma factor for flagellar operon FliA